MLAFREAVKAGAGGIEMDVRKTADQVFIMMHDLSADRTTNGTGFVDQLNYAGYLEYLDAGSWKGDVFADRIDVRIPTLPQVLDEFQGSEVDLILHLKREDSLEVLRIIQQRDMLGQVIFFGNPSVINIIKKAEANAFTQNDGAPGPDSYERVLNNAIEYNHNAVSVSCETVTKEMINHIKRFNKLVHGSFLTSEYETEVQRLVEWGVDFVLGNHTGKMNNGINLKGDVR
ncbi:MAG: Glycerophosphoryl diester phosphodiesterase YhdW [Paenibacillus sp.]|nr:Glycerophosphoryl diester phosphodiesterase YhdW [Paenibacillus sp.]